MNASYIHGLIGGALIGLAAVILYAFNGRIMGVSGITSRLLTQRGQDTWWRLAFVVGLVLGGWILKRWMNLEIVLNASVWGLIVAGLLVGYGTVLGNGCTSGHGICGIARLSKRSMVATACFMVAGIITVFLRRKLGL